MMTFPVVGQRQQRCPTGGHDESGTCEEGTTFAVLVPDFVEDEVVFDAPFTFNRCPTSMVYGGEIPFMLARSFTLVPVIRDMRYRVSPRFTV